MIAPFKYADLQVVTSRLVTSRPDLGTFEPFDRYCHECLMQHLTASEARRLLKMMQTSALIKLPNGDLMRIKGGTDESRLTRAKAAYPNGILLNGMPEAELIKHL